MYWPPTCIQTPHDVPLRGPIGHRPQPPCHLISYAHEWINEIPTVPIYYLAKPQPRERAWQNQRGKKTLNSMGLIVLITSRPLWTARQPGTGEPKGRSTNGNPVVSREATVTRAKVSA